MLPVHDQPMVYDSLSTLMLAGSTFVGTDSVALELGDNPIYGLDYRNNSKAPPIARPVQPYLRITSRIRSATMRSISMPRTATEIELRGHWTLFLQQ
jgi:hypothetical protein